MEGNALYGLGRNEDLLEWDDLRQVGKGLEVHELLEELWRDETSSEGEEHCMRASSQRRNPLLTQSMRETYSW